MGYRIEYGQTVKYETADKPKNNRNILFVTIAIVAALILFGFCTDAVRSFVLPGDPQITEQALNTFAQQVREGEHIGDAAAAFCREIISGAEIA